MSRAMREMFDVIDKDVTIYTVSGQHSGICRGYDYGVIMLVTPGDRRLFIKKEHIVAIRDDSDCQHLDENGELVSDDERQGV